MIHPRQFGSGARVLGPCVREFGLFSIEDAVWKLSGFACERFELKNRGVIRQDAFADLVVFDPAEVTDHATHDNPQEPATGIDDVIVNGRPVVRSGRPLELDCDATLPGRFLRFGQ